MIDLHILLIFMILGAIIAVETTNLLSAIVAVGAVGLGLSTAFLALKAPDLAIVQLVVEILALLILLRATVGNNVKYIDKYPSVVSYSTIIAFLIVFLACVYLSIRNLPSFGEPIMKVSKTYIENGLNETGAANLVSAIILDYRGYDTLGEATILFTAVIGALAVLRATGRKKKEKENE